MPNPAPTYPAPLESNVSLTQTPIVNLSGEPNNTIVKRPRGCPFKKLTKVQICNPVGLRKITQKFNPKKTSTNQTEPQYTNVISSQDTNEKVYASHQYIKETIFYDPPKTLLFNLGSITTVMPPLGYNHAGHLMHRDYQSCRADNRVPKQCYEN